MAGSLGCPAAYKNPLQRAPRNRFDEGCLSTPEFQMFNLFIFPFSVKSSACHQLAIGSPWRLAARHRHKEGGISYLWRIRFQPTISETTCRDTLHCTQYPVRSKCCCCTKYCYRSIRHPACLHCLSPPALKLRYQPLPSHRFVSSRFFHCWHHVTEIGRMLHARQSTELIIFVG